MGADRDLPDLDALWDFARPEASEQAFRDLLPLAEAAGAWAYRLELLTQIARAQGLQGRFAEAHQTLDEVKAGLAEASPRARLRYLLERGRVLSSSGDLVQAAPLFREAWELGRSHDEDALTIDAAHMLGIVEPPEQQLAWSLRALDLAERSGDSRARRWLGPLGNNIGWSYHDLGQYDEALAMFRRAVAWREAEGQPRPIVAARWCEARALRSLGQIEAALAIQRDLLAKLEQLGERDGYVHEEVAECLLALGQAGAAQPHFALAHAALSADPWLAEHEPARLRRLQALGQAASPEEPTA